MKKTSREKALVIARRGVDPTWQSVLDQERFDRVARASGLLRRSTPRNDVDEQLSDGEGDMRKYNRLIWSLLLFFLLIPSLAIPTLACAGELDLARQVQHDLIQSKGLVSKIAVRQHSGQAVRGEIARLKALAGNIAVSHQLLRELFAAQDSVTSEIGPVAIIRHAAMREEYLGFIDEYLRVIAALPDDTVPDYLLDTLKSRLESLLPEHPAPLLGALPYRHLRLPSQLPLAAPTLTPAYLDKKRPFTPEDLASSPEAPITVEIAALAQSLHWSPAEIYGWVTNNIKSEWYWGLMKGAEETLHQKSGNDADQAALLVALLRASGYPARFVRGVIEFFPDPAGILAQTGVSDPQALAGFFQKAGIPWQPVIRGGRIVNLQIEHIWVETQIPYDNYRGAIIDTRGKSWLALDTQIKLGKVTANNPPALPPGVDLANLRDQYLAEARPESPLAFLRAEVTSAGANYDSLLHQRTPATQLIQIVPASLQFTKIAVTGEYPTLPDTLKHRVRIVASQGETILFDSTLPLSDLSNRSLAVVYEPATVEDQEIINAYGGLGNTPAYLVHLRPVLTVDGERTLIGTSGLPVGSDFQLAVELIAPNQSERIDNQLTIGNLAVLGLVAQQVVAPEELAAGDKSAERLLYERALSYIDQWNQAEEELAALLDLPLLRPLPTLVTVGGVVEVVWLLDTPHGFEWRGVYVDAGFRAVELVGEAVKQKTFMQLSGLQGSVLEERVLSDGFGVPAVSTAKLLGLSSGEGLPPLVLNRANLAAELPGLGLPANVAEDISNAVAQGLTVTIPPVASSYEDWQGVGYLKEDLESGEAGWMLSGQIAGGMTAWNPERWPLDAAAEVLANPGKNQPNYDPGAAMFIQKITATDLQVGTVGQALPKNLQVYVTDRNRKPVKGAAVIFTVKAGGGNLSGQPTLTAKSDQNGIAQALLTTGQHTADNPSLWWEQGATYSQQVGENIVDAALKSGDAIASPFSALAKPEVPDHIKQTLDIDIWSYVLLPHGALGLLVEDRYGNSIANQKVTFTGLPPENLASCANPGADPRPALLMANDEPCAASFPSYDGSCGHTSLSVVTNDKGASAQVIAGPMPEALYRVTASVAGLPAVEFKRRTYPEVDCVGGDKPIAELVLGMRYTTDIFGHLINAGPLGGKVPVAVRCTLLRENGVETGTGTYYLANSYGVEVVMRPPPVAMTAKGHGVYEDEYTLANTPGLNEIIVTCSADVDEETLSGYSVLPVYGVEVRFPYAADNQTPPEAVLVAVNEEGYLTRDQVLSYQILPAAYKAASAYLVVYRDGVPIFIVPTEKTGIGFATLARGMWLGPGGDYEVEVALNPGSGVEIRSAKIPLKVITLELDADLNGDGIFAEDDPLEYTSPGLIVPLNNDDDDGDGVMDYDDGFDKDNWPGTADDAMLKTNPDGSTSPANDDELAEVHLTALPEGLGAGTVALELIQGQEQVRVWSSRDKGKENVLLDAGGINGATSRKEWRLSQDIATLAELPPVLYLEGVKAATAASGPAILLTKYISPEGVEVEMDRLLISVYELALVPDYNRDGKIDGADKGKVTAEKPWRFWVNDDNDKGSDALTGLGGDDTPGSGPDYQDGTVNGIRDLVDFFPLHLDIAKTLSLLPPAAGYSYYLRQADSAVGMIETALTVDEANYYLEDLDVAAGLRSAPVKTVDAQGVALSAAFLEAIAANQYKGVLLLEGRKESTAALALEIRDSTGAVVIAQNFLLEIMPVSAMTGHKDLRPVTGGSAGDPSRKPVSPPYAMTEGSNKVLVWMHGYFVSAIEARATYAEVFKRFFHAGLKGQFYGVSWFGDPPDGTILPTPHYHQAVVNAFATAQDFAVFVEGLDGEVSIAAHSLGNLVAGSAIQDHNLTKFNKYFAIDAAVALEAYGQTEVDEGMLTVDTWLDYWKYTANDSQGNPVMQDQKLLASEWYKLFENDVPVDNRKYLTWRNRLNQVPSNKVYNFYSSTEEVLRSYPGDDIATVLGLLQNITALKEYLSISTWVKQEKYKGRSLTVNAGGVSSPFAGWSFSSAWKKGIIIKRHFTPEEAANEISEEALSLEPFFARDTSLFSHGLDNLTTPGNTGTAPSDYVMKTVSGTGLKSYYTDNAPAQDRVKVKDWLLAEAFPATTLPMGANYNDEFTALRNFDMSGVRNSNGGCCKTEELRWPRKENGNLVWFHSDYKDISFQHVFAFYKKIKELSGN